jgi:small subunit ribosomal protein S17
MENNCGRKRTLMGTVKSSGKMEKTVTVLVERRVKHPLYKKYIIKHKKYLAHDEKNEYSVGDRVIIVESKPLSKIKRWRVHKLIKHEIG